MSSDKIGKLVSLLPGDLLHDSAIGDWYKKNPYHKFSQGDILILKRRTIHGYGVRPVALVNLFEIREGEEGKYDLTLYEDTGREVYYLRWRNKNEIPKDVERRITEHKFYSKWEIESRFKKVPDKKVEEAVNRYKSSFS